MYISLSKSTPSHSPVETLDPTTDVSSRYDTIAPRFDLSVSSTESLIGITRLRRKLSALATGDVLEVSIGTGRNLTFYDWNFTAPKSLPSSMKRGKVKSFTAVDKSEPMLEIAHDKFSKEYPGILGIRWVVQDAVTTALPAPPVSANERSGNKKNKKYDTIIQTMGLCSTPNPTALLQNMADALEPDGQILLLEHGRSTWDFVNWALDRGAPGHADRYGCWWNKDIEGVIKGCGLEVLEFKRKHFGTTVWAILGKKGAKREEIKDRPMRGWGDAWERLQRLWT